MTFPKRSITGRVRRATDIARSFAVLGVLLGACSDPMASSRGAREDASAADANGAGGGSGGGGSGGGGAGGGGGANTPEGGPSVDASSGADGHSTSDAGSISDALITDGGSGGDARIGADVSDASAPRTDASLSDATRADVAISDVTSTDAQVPPPGFWDPSGIPAAKNVMVFKFLNRTNGKYADSEVYWSFKSGAIAETHSIAAQPLYDMPANSSGRMYFYICATGDAACATDPTKSKYFDFIEHTIGAKQYNGNTTRVDAFGLKLAMRLHCADSFEATVGEDYETFLDDRAITFQKFLDSVPAEFQSLAEAPHAPYRIVEPGAGGFNAGGAYEHYYDAFIDQIWSANGITIAKAGANGSGLGSYPDLSAAIYRHVGGVAGSFDAAGKLLDKKLWTNSATFYPAAPANYYARFWHLHALDGKAYGFPYDDVGGYSSYISHTDPQYMMVAIGW
ncbi:MAG TPA: beta-1,3-glucanase family protein [Polyangiaceae bacterium]|nr:beta-1,3-glucanase family protein [Polyangiaceae bacterium]